MDNTKIVGEKIKSLRETKQISIAELAERTGLAIEQIERIENNVDIPSLAPLIKIARALGVRLGTFLDDQEEVGAVITRKQDNSQSTISFSNNAMNARTHMHYQSLSKSKADRHMEPFIIDIEATDETNYEVSSHEGEEFIFVMEGTEAYAQSTCYLDEWSQGWEVHIVFDTFNLFDGQSCTFCQFGHANLLRFAKRFNLLSYNFCIVHTVYILYFFH